MSMPELIPSPEKKRKPKGIEERQTLKKWLREQRGAILLLSIPVFLIALWAIYLKIVHKTNFTETFLAGNSDMLSYFATVVFGAIVIYQDGKYKSREEERKAEKEEEEIQICANLLYWDMKSACKALAPFFHHWMSPKPGVTKAQYGNDADIDEKLQTKIHKSINAARLYFVDDWIKCGTTLAICYDDWMEEVFQLYTYLLDFNFLLDECRTKGSQHKFSVAVINNLCKYFEPSKDFSAKLRVDVLLEKLRDVGGFTDNTTSISIEWNKLS